VTFSTVTELVAAQENLPVDHGVLVTKVEAGGPAAAAGIAPGDVIVAIAGEQIGQQQSFIEILFAHKPGETVELTVQRGNEQLTVQVVLGERPPDA
jgi:S1-C subfamily serine protease